MLFNKSNNGSVELRDATGSYYANNKFERIKTDVMLAEKQIRRLVGLPVYQRAIAHYKSEDYLPPSSTEEREVNDKLVDHLQIPIAYLATFNYYQSNLVSHEDTGRKVKLDNENEKMPWEWMLDRDDQAQLRKIHDTQDLLIEFLEENKIAEWLDSENRRLARSLFVSNQSIFQDAYPIDNSPRFYYTLMPFMREVQERTIKKALGDIYADLLSYYQSEMPAEGSSSGSSGGGIPGPENEELLQQILPLVQSVIPLLTMAMAVKRLSLQVLPEGVVQQFKSMLQSRNASTAAAPELVKMYSQELTKDANYLLDDIKLILLSADPEANEYRLQPKNDEANKFFRT